MDWTANTLWIFTGSILIGSLCGLLGCLAILRRQALVGDVVAHSALPGAILVAAILVTPASSLILAGGVVTALVGAGLLHFFDRRGGNRPRTDAAMAVTLASLFGLGIVIASIPRSDGLAVMNAYRFILGQPASILPSDLVVLGLLLAGVATLGILFAARWQAWLLDPAWSTVHGAAPQAMTQAVQLLIILGVVLAIPVAGVVLAVAGVILPPLIVRPFARSLSQFALLAALVGGAMGGGGVLLALTAGDLPTGPVVVLLSCIAFACTLPWQLRRGVAA